MLIKRASLIGALAVVVFATAGCFQTTNPNAPVNVPPPSTEIGKKIEEGIAVVQDRTAKICSFVPTADTVAKIFVALGGSGVATTATGIATDICNSLSSRKLASSHPMARRAAPPTVAGVTVRGRYIR